MVLSSIYMVQFKFNALEDDDDGDGILALVFQILQIRGANVLLYDSYFTKYLTPFKLILIVNIDINYCSKKETIPVNI